jgi:uncharacterized protein
VDNEAVAPMRRQLLPLLTLTVSLLGGDSTALAAEYPAPVGKVNDFAALLTTDDRRALEEQLKELERDTSAEVAVVTVRGLAGRTVEEYATGMFAQWAIGKKDADNGVLILVAVDDRAMRIEVGYGLEGILPDGLAGSVIRETFLPRFRENDYRRGLIEGTARVIEIVRRHQAPTEQERAAPRVPAVQSIDRRWLVLVLALPVGLGAYFAGMGAGSKVVKYLLAGLAIAGAGLSLCWSAALGMWTVVLSLLGLAVMLASFRSARQIRSQFRPRARRGSDGWVITDGGSGASGSGSGSGDSSFGGGDSGGGGASGHW